MTNSEALFKEILIPVDGSRYSLAAVRLAGRLSRIHSSRITIIHVIDTQIEEQLCRLKKDECETIRRNMQEEAEGLVQDMKRELLELGVDAETMVLRGTPHEIILDIASKKETDLIVMGKLGRRGIKRILLGSVAERVLEFSTCPVLCVSDRNC